MSIIRSALILVVDDDPEDQEMIVQALGEGRLPMETLLLEDGAALMEYLENPAARMPDMILLDINMPRMNGIEALNRIKQDDRFKSLPVVMLTTSKSQEDVIRSYQLGCNSYISKPVLYDTLVDLMNMLREYWVETVEQADIQQLLDRHVRENTAN